MKKARLALTDSEIKEKSLAIFNHCKTLIEKDTKILCYKSFNNEVDTNPFYDYFENVYAPKCIGKGIMIGVDTHGQWETSKYGILEPVSNTEETNIKVAIVPGIAFDSHGNRIGFGAGFYDRYFEKYPDIIKIAVCFDFQKIEHIESEPWDIPMDYIVTEKGIIKL